MKAEILNKTDEAIRIVWENDDGFGHLSMKWDKKLGRHILDSEYVGINTIIEIFKALE